MTVVTDSLTIFRMGICQSTSPDEADNTQVKVLDTGLFDTKRSVCVKVEIIHSDLTQEYNGKETLCLALTLSLFIICK